MYPYPQHSACSINCIHHLSVAWRIVRMLQFVFIFNFLLIDGSLLGILLAELWRQNLPSMTRSCSFGRSFAGFLCFYPHFTTSTGNSGLNILPIHASHMLDPTLPSTLNIFSLPEGLISVPSTCNEWRIQKC